MNDTGSDQLIDDEAVARLRAIFDRSRPVRTDADLLELADLVEDESVDAADDGTAFGVSY